MNKKCSLLCINLAGTKTTPNDILIISFIDRDCFALSRFIYKRLYQIKLVTEELKWKQLMMVMLKK